MKKFLNIFVLAVFCINSISSGFLTYAAWTEDDLAKEHFSRNYQVTADKIGTSVFQEYNPPGGIQKSNGVEIPLVFANDPKPKSGGGNNLVAKVVYPTGADSVYEPAGNDHEYFVFADPKPQGTLTLTEDILIDVSPGTAIAKTVEYHRAIRARANNGTRINLYQIGRAALTGENNNASIISGPTAANVIEHNKWYTFTSTIDTLSGSIWVTVTERDTGVEIVSKEISEKYPTTEETGGGIAVTSNRLSGRTTSGAVTVYYDNVTVKGPTSLGLAVVAVERAEQSRAQADVNIAQPLINILEDENKDILQERLNVVINVINAIAKVAVAESSILAADYITAKALVDNITAATEYSGLKARLDAIIEAVVVKAEGSGYPIDIENAEAIVNTMDAGQAKTNYVNRIAAIVRVDPVVAAQTALSTARSSLSAEDIATAERLVNAVPSDNGNKASLLTELTLIKNIAAATAAVEVAATSKLKTDYNAAMSLVNALPSSAPEKNLLLTALNNIEIFTELQLAEMAVAKVEDSKLLADYNAAKTLVEVLEPGDVRNDLERRLNLLKITIDSLIYNESFEKPKYNINDNVPNGLSKGGETQDYTSYIVEADPKNPDNQTAVMRYMPGKSIGGGSCLGFYNPTAEIPAVNVQGTITIREDLMFNFNNPDSKRPDRSMHIRTANATGTPIILYNIYFPYNGGNVASFSLYGVGAGEILTNNIWYRIETVVDTVTNMLNCKITRLDTGVVIFDTTRNNVTTKEVALSIDPHDFSAGTHTIHDRLGSGGIPMNGSGAIYNDNIMITSETPYSRAVAALVNAESVYTRSSYEVAKELIDTLTGVDKTELLARLDVVSITVEAVEAVKKVELSRLQTDYTDAYAKVAALPEGNAKKQSLLDRLSVIIGFNTVTFKKSGSPTTTLTSGSFTAEVSATNNTGSPCTAQTILVLYKKIGVNKQMQTFTVGEKKTLNPEQELQLTVPALTVPSLGNDSDTYILALYVWDDMDGMQPFMAEQSITNFTK